MTPFERGFILILFSILLASSSTYAQDSSHTALDGYTPTGLAPGSPAGSYALSDFDTINPYNGNINFNLPLIHVGGRGSAGYTIQLPIEQNWVVNHAITDDGYGGHLDFYGPDFNDWSGIKPGYSPGVLVGRQATVNSQWCAYNGSNSTPYQTLTRLTFTPADGTQYELRDQLTQGNPATLPPCALYGPTRGHVFTTEDGEAATFISDTDILDSAYFGASVIYPSGYLMLRDGTRYRIDNGGVTWIRDRNGNQVTFNTNGVFATDSLKRTISIVSHVNDATCSLCDTITYNGFGGTSRTIIITKTNLINALRPANVQHPAETPRTPRSLFPELNNADSYNYNNPTVTSAVTLPNGKSYKFYYNSYGEIARVELPTGGAYEYDWAAGIINDYASGVDFLTYERHIYRRVIERRVYPDGVTLESRMTISRPDTLVNGNVQSSSYVEVDQKDANGNLLAASRHYYYGNAYASIAVDDPLLYPGWREGKEYQAEQLDTNDSTVLERSVSNWQQPPLSVWCPGAQTDGCPRNNPRITETDTILEPSGANKVSAQTYAYDQYVNKTDIYEYDYGTGGAGPLVRRTQTSYLTTKTIGSNTYDYACDPSTTCGNNANIANVIHIRSLPVQTSVYDASGTERARTVYEYDNYATDTYHAGLVGRSSISSLDSAFTATTLQTRGNATATTRYLLTNGNVTGSVVAYAQYDVAGNVVKSFDPKGNATTFDFSDRYGTPNGEAESNPGPTNLGAQVSYACPTKMTNAAGQITFAQFDYYTGKIVDAEDANGIVSSAYYNDTLDRPTQIIRAVNDTSANSAKSQTTFAYDDTNRIITTTSDQTAFNDNVLKAQIVYDKLGRKTESRQYESGTTYIAVDQVYGTYDAQGRRVDKVSNPFRAGDTLAWTTTAHDALNRVVAVTTPDNAVVSTVYSGNQVTVTDPASKVRSSVSDALGRLVTVTEAPNNPSYNYQTTYNYDVLDDLITVTQGTQTRSLVYDSLKRLTSATNPESGTVSYGYDANSNLTSKTDARTITVSYTYDVLNRNITVDYSNTTISPDINRYYDNPATGAYGKGRPWYDNFNEVDGHIEQQKTISYDSLGRPGTHQQNFYANNAWSNYQVSRTYDKAGHPLTETYPSGHTVNYNYDAAGRPADNGSNLAFTGSLGDNLTRTYAQSITYNARNQMQEERYGTTTSLYHKLHYNSRGQLYDIRLSTVPWATDPLNWNRGCLAFYYDSGYHWGGGGGQDSGPDNNGDVLRAQNWVPADDQMSTYQLWDDFYIYDGLDRLSQVQMNHAGLPVLLQTFQYDRWGNRTINASQTSTSAGIPAPQYNVNTVTNQLTSAGTGTMTYDPAGNLIVNSYLPPTSGATNFTYDAENRLTVVKNGGNQVLASYAYDAGGHRVRRIINGLETWQVYGLDGELVAEYAANAAATAPQKEYGYRGGALLITAAPTDPQQLNTFITSFYQNSLGRQPNATELQQQTTTLNSAAAQGQTSFFNAASAMGQALFLSTEYAQRNRTDHQ